MQGSRSNAAHRVKHAPTCMLLPLTLTPLHRTTISSVVALLANAAAAAGHGRAAAPDAVALRLDAFPTR